MSKAFLITYFLVHFNFAISKVDPPNYDFSLNKFDVFMPGNKLGDIEKVYKNKELVFKENQFVTYKFYVSHLRYKFATIVQFQNGIVTDFYARLPQYFLHDIFHQSLINKIGKQDIFKNVDEHSIYIWKNKNNLKHFYAGMCTITCFPIYYSVKYASKDLGSNYKSLIKKFSD